MRVIVSFSEDDFNSLTKDVLELEVPEKVYDRTDIYLFTIGTHLGKKSKEVYVNTLTGKIYFKKKDKDNKTNTKEEIN